MRVFKPSPTQLYYVINKRMALPRAFKTIRKNKEIEIVHLEADPLLREGDEFKDFLEACIGERVPVSFETSSDVPDEIIALINRHRFSEIRFNLPTLDPKKLKKLIPDSADPETICNGIVRTFNAGSYAILNVTPVVPNVTSIQDILSLIVQMHNFVEAVEITFAEFEPRPFRKFLRAWRKTNPEIVDYFELVDGLQVIKPEIKKRFFEKLQSFAEGMKIKIVLRENGMEDYGKVFER